MSSFVACGKCGREWTDRESFLDDPALEILGYQVNFRDLGRGMFMFNHDCQSTLSVPVEPFMDLYSGTIFRDKKTGTESCPGYCLHRDNLRPCPAECNCAFVREVIQVVRGRQAKTGTGKGQRQ